VGGAVPRVARVHIMTADNAAVQPGTYRSIAAADAMLTHAFEQVPPPVGKPYDAFTYAVIWTDGFRLQDTLYITQQRLLESQADGGPLRHGILRRARVQESGDAYRGFAKAVVEPLRAEGRDLLRRLEADAAESVPTRNVGAATWRGPTLLPAPGDAIGHLRARFAQRRALVPVASDEASSAASYPATNHADVRYLTNFISIALGNDLSALAASTAAAIWNHWRDVVQTVQRELAAGNDTDPYPDNERLWRAQIPCLARMLDEAVATGGALRNGRLAFRQVGNRGEPYPAWVQDLRDRSGVYVIRERQPDGTSPIVYVGESHTDRLHETRTRHFRTWRRWKGFWRGQYGEGHDPGLTYDRDAAEAAVVITPAQHALEMEARLIRRLRPRDNLLGQAEGLPF